MSVYFDHPAIGIGDTDLAPDPVAMLNYTFGDRMAFASHLVKRTHDAKKPQCVIFSGLPGSFANPHGDFHPMDWIAWMLAYV